MRYLEDFEVGELRELGEHEVSRQEIIEFATQWDPQPFHIDEAAAKASLYGGLTASSLHLFAICTRLFFDHEDRIAVLAMLGKDAVRFPNPARMGDRLTYTTECIEARVSQSKPDRGVIRLRDEVHNQDQVLVLTQEVSLLVARRPGELR